MQETLESIYVVNKHARKYARKAHEHYESDRHAPATRNSARKEALYALKGRVLSEISSKSERIERHEIDEREYLCLYIEGFSFHALPDEIEVDSAEVGEEVEKLEDFQKGEQKKGTSRSLKASLLHLQKEFGVSANDLLPKRSASYAHRESFNGWDYLKEGLMDPPVWKQKIERARQRAREMKEKRSDKPVESRRIERPSDSSPPDYMQ